VDAAVGSLLLLGCQIGLAEQDLKGRPAFFLSVRLSEGINPEVPTHLSSANKATSMYVWPLNSPAFKQSRSYSCEYLDCKIMMGFLLLDLFMKTMIRAGNF